MIYLPPPQPVLNKDIRISGDVAIHPTASLAPGVILQAAPNCHISIGADVCIGMGVIINASHGSIEIGSGAIVGSGVLIVGQCQIGNNACIGTAVTIFQANVEAMKVIEPGSVLGDSSRKVSQKVSQEEKSQQNQAGSFSTTPKVNQNSQSKVGSDGFYSPKSSKDKAKRQTKDINQENTSKTADIPTPPIQETKIGIGNKVDKEPVVGQVYINQLLITLFPNNKDFDSKNRRI